MCTWVATACNWRRDTACRATWTKMLRTCDAPVTTVTTCRRRVAGHRMSAGVSVTELNWAVVFSSVALPNMRQPWGERAIEAEVYARPWSLDSWLKWGYYNGQYDVHCCAINYATFQWLFGSRATSFPHVKALWKWQKSNPPNPGFWLRLKLGFRVWELTGYLGFGGPGVENPRCMQFSLH